VSSPSIRAPRVIVFLLIAFLLAVFLSPRPAECQSSSDKPAGPLVPVTKGPGAIPQTKSNGDNPPAGTNPTVGQKGEQGGSSKSANGSVASPSSIAPAPAPPGPAGRPSIGLALAGGSAYAMSEIGVLEWFEEHHIPVDMIAGTSMGSLVGALYATGRTPAQIKAVMTTDVFNSVFRVDTAYKNQGFRRRQDSRNLPNGLTVGLRHGISLRNSVLTDQGLNAFFDREFYRYDDRSEFNSLPIPFRCISTDLNDAKVVTFARGSIPDAVRASVSLPGVYRPFELDGHEYVDGGVLDNLPTRTIHDMHADVTLAVSIPLLPVGKGDLDSIFGVLQRSFSVAIEANERASRNLANVVMIPDLTGLSVADFLKTGDLAARGYAAAEQNKDALMKYALDDAQWAEYLRSRASRVRAAPGTVLRVRVKAPDTSDTRAVQQLFQSLVDKPMNTDAVEALLADIRSDGRYDADYTVTYEAPPSSDHLGARADRPTILVTVSDKKTGPPFLLLGLNIAAETSTTPRATIEGILLDQDLGGYGSELRSHIKAGWMNESDTEYFRKLKGGIGGDTTEGAKLGELFAAPNIGLKREPFYIYQNQVRLSERQLQSIGGGLDFGWTDQRTREFRAGWEMDNIRWQTEVGSGADSLPNVYGATQKARMRFVYDNQDRELVPQYGMRLVAQAGYLYNTVASPNAPQITAQATFAHKIGKNLALFSLDSGTMLNRNVAQPFRFTLGGPARLTASAIDEYRGTDYFLVSPAFLRRIASLPAPLGHSIYVGAAYEAGQMRAPDARTITRQDVYFGIVAETPLGVIMLAPAIGDDGHRKFVFTLGKFF
jgi:NTE family protein